jgi:hypothetical protein
MKHLKIILINLIMYCSITQTTATTSRTLTVVRGKISVNQYDETYMNKVLFQKNSTNWPNKWFNFNYNKPIDIPAGADSFFMEAPPTGADSFFMEAPTGADSFFMEAPIKAPIMNKIGNDLTIKLPTSGNVFTYQLDYTPEKTTMRLISIQ